MWNTSARHAGWGVERDRQDYEIHPYQRCIGPGLSMGLRGAGVRSVLYMQDLLLFAYRRG